MATEQTPEPIAIIGLSCKFSGEASDAGGLWRLVAEGRDAWSQIPPARFNWAGSYHRDQERPGTMHVRSGYFLKEDIGSFDAAFFNLSAETAAAMDPQFRLQLESVYEAFENAGQPMERVAGSDTSVYMGTFNHDYREGMIRDEDRLPRFMITGTGAAMASNRVSHFFDLRGASMTLDTGCSTSLVALHQAVRDLRSGVTGMAVVGSSNLMLNPDMFKALGSIGVLSPDGKSYSFDNRANGYGRGEGVATVIIKRWRDAVAAGDPIRAVIRETWINQDGKTETITSPSSDAQEELIRRCYRNALLDPLETQYFEAHGTGTPTGDPIELQAVAAVFRSGRQDREPLRIGSIKANIGHTEPVSGLASLIKVVLALENGAIPPSINFQEPNAKLDLAAWHIKVPQELEPWPTTTDGTRRASINNFGYGGTNAHVIMELGPQWVPGSHTSNRTDGTRNVNGHGSGLAHNAVIKTKPENGINGSHLPRRKTKILVLSARDEQACQEIVSKLKDYLRQHAQHDDPEKLLQSVIYTLGQRRSALPWIAAQPIPYTQGIGPIIEALDSTQFRPKRVTRPPRIGMVFTGQGAQWNAMGRELIIAYPVFRASLEEGDGYLAELGADWSLVEELMRDIDTTRVNDTALSIPICAALQISLVRLLRSWGITPTAVTSHSSGEIAAAYTAGALNYQTSMAIAYHRSVLSADKRLRGSAEGGMVAVGVGPEEGGRYLKQLTGHGRACIACINSPKSVTIAGDLSAILQVESGAKSDGVMASRLKVDIGYHSHQMEPISDAYAETLSQLAWDDTPEGSLGSIIYSSPVTGGRVTNVKDVASPAHWVASLVQPVEFLDAFTSMVMGDFDPSGSSVDVVVEIGPHTALRGPIRQILELPEFTGVQLPYYGSLSRNSDARDTMQTLAANLMKEGWLPHMDPLNFPWGRDSDVKVLSDLPSYNWNHQTRHWVEPRFNRALRERDQEPHDLIGSLVLGTDLGCPSWRHILRLSSSPWLRDHVVQSNVLYPGAGFVCLAIEAAAQIVSMNTMEPVMGPTRDRKVSGYRLRDVDILQALLVPDNSEGTEVQTKIRPADDKEVGLKGWMHFEVKSVTADNHWTLHARGSLCVEYDDTSSTGRTKLDELVPLMPSTATRIAPDDMFASFRSVGIEHGLAFQNLKTIVQSQTDQRSITTLVVADAAGSPDVPRKLVIHPTTLDSIVQAAYTALPKAGYFQESPRVPRKIRNLWISNSISHDTGHMFNACSQVNDADSQSFEADIRVFNAENDTDGPVLEIQGLLLQSLGQAIGPRNKKPWEREVCNGVEWDIDMGLVSYASLREIERDLRHVGSHERLASDLKPVCLYFIEACLKKLTTAEVSRLSGHFVKFYKWMQDQARLASAGKLSTASNEWLSYSAEERVRRVKLASMESVVGEMVCHLGPYLADMVRGEKAPLELMVQDRLLYRYYEEAPNLKRCFNQTSRLLRKIVHKNPRARILEIGAGTGSVTRHALEVLGTTQSGGPLAGLYHYTDVSMGFFEAAKSEFSAWNDILAFDKLDIEQDPGTQGFALESYDIVIACEVLHATKSISRTMANVRSLMKPGGSLLLVETTQDQIDIQFVFGLLPGWWLSEESNRQTSPSLDVPSWDHALKNAGFTGVEVAINDCEDASAYAFSTILSRVPPATTHTELMSEDIVLVVDSEAIPPQDWVTSLARSLGSVGSSPEVHVFDSPAVTEATWRGKICVFLGEVHRNVLFEMSSATLERLKLLVANCAGLVWITVGGAVNCENPCSALATGFVRSLRNEYVGRRFMTLDLDPTASAWSSTSCQAISQILNHAFSENDIGILDTPLVEFEYAERAGAILTPRYLKDATRNEIVSPDRQYQSSPGEIATELFHQHARPLRLQVGTRGLLDTLVFDDDRQAITSDTPLPESLVEIQVYAYGLNFRDVMVAMGQLEDKVMGIECAGIITRVGQLAASHGHVVGDRVFCLLRGPFGSRVHTEWWNVVPMPDGLSFEEAASMPMIFTTAYVALVDVAHLQRGQSILVHAAAGGVGQAAIQLAQWLGANIYATVGTPEKRKLIRHKYGIPDHQIFNSRDTSFGTSVLNATGGRGVDMVLNSLAGPLLQEGFNVVAPFGHFVEIGKRDLEQNNLLEMRPFARHVSFSALDILNMTSGRGDDIRRVLTEIARLTTRRVITPIDPITRFPISDITKAFRLMQTGKHTGKVVVSTGPQDMVSVQHHRKTVQLSPNASYLLVGGLGGIGRCIASWLVQVGAKSIILLSRSAGASEKDRMFVQDLSRTGCKIKPLSCDVSKGDDLQRALQICKDDGLPAIRGVIQAAMVLQDSVLEQMTLDSFRAAMLPKVNGSWNLHSQFQQVDFFIMLSSINGIVGYASQSNYSAGGSYQDALARWRVGSGLPAVSLDLCAVKTVGYVAETAGVATRMQRAGHMLLREDQLLGLIESAILDPFNPQVVAGLNTGPGSHWNRDGESQLGRDARFAALQYRQPQQQSQGDDDRSANKGSLATRLAEATSREEAEALVFQAVAQKLSAIFVLPVEEIDPARHPSQYGVDSLVAVELRNMLSLQAAADISIFNILQSQSLSGLAGEVVHRSRYTEVA